ncbi:hypothetical protein SeMB42_g06977 [Synchytrium endobioticum]|uniref:Retrotransposon gag domain-containing protein n=1 Tax=Synchytrium endobioticum TaxID=286115 RepID=A0A507CGY7_9FUNG|nr:hypothetical protein SeLEV6574_g08253 [Synchytrium endobioticum]TPX37254.1 hypothetical protein SeMB42_g06977 [Synchytrium endobioticum]
MQGFETHDSPTSTAPSYATLHHKHTADEQSMPGSFPAPRKLLSHPSITQSTPHVSLHINQSAEPPYIGHLPRYSAMDRTKCETLLKSADIVFKIHPKGYSQDFQKILFIGSHLDGAPLLWFHDLFIHSESTLLDSTSYNDFKQLFASLWGDFHAKNRASDRLVHFRQGSNTLSEYAGEFYSTALQSSLWGNQRALFRNFMKGLNRKTSKKVIGRQFSSIDELVYWSMKSDAASVPLGDKRNDT